VSFAAAAILQLAAACAPLDESAEGTDVGDDDAGVFEDKALPSGSYQAESRTAQSGCSQATNHAGYTGSGFVDFGGNGTWIEWNNVSAPLEGRYELRFRYANASTESRTSSILVNGRSVGTLPFVTTRAWSTWSTATIGVSLNRGNNTIRVVASNGTGGPNLDRMDVVGTDLCPSDSSKVEPGQCGCGVPEGSCGGGGTCALATENASVTLSCAAGQAISAIKFASYGTPSGSCPSGFSTGSCHASSSKQKVEEACLGKQSCSVEARNSVFSDPCSGTGKRLGVVYSCSGGVTPPPPPPPGPATLLDRPSNTKLRIGSWNVFRGSVFPRTDDVWKAINSSAKYQTARSDAGTRIFRAMDADIWLLQETVYTTSDLPSGITVNDINSRIAQHMRSVTGDTWNVRCNGEGLCVMIRGSLRFAESYNPHGRVAGNRIVLPDGSKVLVVNVHYMNVDHAEKTASLINSAGSGDVAVFVGGDFNDSIGGSRYNTVDAVSGMAPLSMFHARDPKATHLDAAVASAPQFKNTGGQVAFGGGPSGQDVVTSVSGGTIDHFFLRSSKWQGEHRFILNSFLLSPATLSDQRLTPLDVALEPQGYQTYFRDFLTRGVVYELPSTMRGIGHDHLPMIIDFTWP
jgi:hypothetical protein